MDLKGFSKKIQGLIIGNEEVKLPGLGCFKVESLPAAFLEDGKTIVPPSKKLQFIYDVQVQGEDSDLQELAASVLAAINSDGNFELPGVGKFAAENGEVEFIADENFDFAPDNFSLEAISLEINEPEVEPEAEPQEEPQPTAQPKKSLPKWTITLLVILAILILLVVLLIIFKEDFKPLLQNILYTEEELEIMRKWAAR